MNQSFALKLPVSGLTAVFNHHYTDAEAERAYKASDKSLGGFGAHFLSKICTFDGNKLTPQEIEQLPGKDFIELGAFLGDVHKSRVKPRAR